MLSRVCRCTLLLLLLLLLAHPMLDTSLHGSVRLEEILQPAAGFDCKSIRVELTRVQQAVQRNRGWVDTLDLLPFASVETEVIINVRTFVINLHVRQSQRCLHVLK
jgi:hypothetical protein